MQGNSYNRHQARNAYGQVIIDPEENLSDKEVYPGQSSTVPAIGTFYYRENELEVCVNLKKISNPSMFRNH